MWLPVMLLIFAAAGAWALHAHEAHVSDAKEANHRVDEHMTAAVNAADGATASAHLKEAASHLEVAADRSVQAARTARDDRERVVAAFISALTSASADRSRALIAVIVARNNVEWAEGSGKIRQLDPETIAAMAKDAPDSPVGRYQHAIDELAQAEHDRADAEARQVAARGALARLGVS